MGLYGDKLTLSTFSSIDHLTRASGFGQDNLAEVFPNEEVVNGSDWTDTNADGLADNWLSSKGTPSIIDDELGSTGRAQKVLRAATGGDLSQLIAPAGEFTTYRLSFKYYLHDESGTTLNMKVSFASTELLTVTTLAALTYVEVDFYVGEGAGSSLLFEMQNFAAGDYFVVDEVSLKIIGSDKLGLN